MFKIKPKKKSKERSVTKYYGYIFEKEKWKRIGIRDIKKMNEMEYRAFQNKYNRPGGPRIHESKNDESPSVSFNKCTWTFHYNPAQGLTVIGRGGNMTASHFLRQKVISEKKLLNLEIYSNKDSVFPNKNGKKKSISGHIVPILVREVLTESTIQIPEHIAGPKTFVRPDIIVKFDEPVDLAMKWKNTLIIEVIETHDLDQDQIDIYEALGYGTVALYDGFNVFSELKRKKPHNNYTKGDLDKVRRIYKNKVKAVLMTNPTSEEFMNNEENMLYFKLYNDKKEQYKKLESQHALYIESSKKEKNELDSDYKAKIENLENQIYKLKNFEKEIQRRLIKWAETKRFFGKKTLKGLTDLLPDLFNKTN